MCRCLSSAVNILTVRLLVTAMILLEINNRIVEDILRLKLTELE